MMDGFSEDALANAAADYHRQLNLTGDGIMGYIKIPSIRVDLPIYHGTEDMTLEKVSAIYWVLHCRWAVKVPIRC